MGEAGITVLLGAQPGPISEADLAGAYPWPAPGRSWLRGMMVATLDGASVGADGRSGSISSRVDRALMAQVRRCCDAILIGAGTFRAERYRPQRPSAEVIDVRTALGLGPAPRLVIVSRSLDLPWAEDAFHESLVPPLVVTAESCGVPELEVARQYAEVAVLPGDRLQPAVLLQLLTAQGLNRIVCEGGPHLLSEIAAAGRLDELDLAVSPVMTGGGQIVLGQPRPEPARFRLAHVIAANGFLFTRYVRSDADTDGAFAEP